MGDDRITGNDGNAINDGKMGRMSGNGAKAPLEAYIGSEIWCHKNQTDNS